MAVSFATDKINLNGVEVISGSLASPAAGAGLAASRGSRYLSTSGRQYLKLTVADIGWRQLLIRGPYFNVVDYGAVGDNVTDNQAAINAAISAAVAAGGGVVFFPPGEYAVYKTGAGAIASFDLNGSSFNNIMFLGCGGSSVIRATGSGYGGDWYLFYVRGTAKYITFKNLAFGGEYIWDPDPAEQNHAIQISQLLTDNAYTGHVRVLDCRFYRFYGDGVRVLGNGATRLVKDVLIKRCEFTMRADALMLDVATTPEAFASGTWPLGEFNKGKYEWTITYTNASAFYAGTHAIFAQDHGGLWIVGGALELRTSPGDAVVFNHPHTWGAGDTITYRLNTVGKTFSVSGALTGNVTNQAFATAGPYWSAAENAGTLYVGDLNGLYDIVGTISDVDRYGTGSRSGVGYQRATYGVNTINCYLTGSDDQQIDMESTASAPMGHHGLDGNHLDHDADGIAAMTLTGTGIGRHSRSVIERNTLLLGGIQGLNVQEAVISDNLVVLDGHPTGAGAALALQERIVANIISNNQFHVGTAVQPSTSAMTFQPGTGGDCRGNTIDGNMSISEGSEGNCASFESQAELLITNSMFQNDLAAGGGGNSTVSIRAVNENGRAEMVSACMVRDTSASRLYGVSLAAGPADQKAILCNGSVVVGATSAAVICTVSGGGSTFDGPTSASGNIGSPASTDPVFYSANNATPAVEGNGGSSLQGIVQVAATPEGLVIAGPGSIAMRTSGAGDGLTMYLKDDLVVDSGGWSSVGPAEFVFGARDLTLATGSLYLAPGMIAVADARQLVLVAQRNLTIRAIRVKQIAGVGGGNTEYRMMRNAATTSNTVTVPFTSTAGNANVAISYAPGELISVRTSKSVAAATSPTEVVVTLEYYFRS